MSTTTLNGLFQFLCGTLSPNNLIWMGEHLIDYAKTKDEHQTCPYSIDEINTRLDLAEQQAAAGLSIDNEEVFRRLNEEFAEDDSEVMSVTQ